MGTPRQLLQLDTMLACIIFDVVVCLSVRLSVGSQAVTSRYCIETTGRI